MAYSVVKIDRETFPFGIKKEGEEEIQEVFETKKEAEERIKALEKKDVKTKK